ncbi:hypothetical protein FW774_01975 (plasmid) [Pedobacter sp. BS3]|uniref:hypothetical protein n=1 Tax=Pedobacter sp. BS3 TaxID=2567937 RepID=UPI0011EBCD05|nr:hypothetical protein [Pedobacter sp. BS3]TZF85862.1 hypothetical protein FW774_01975 [Pedobacter sp. BS3]
MMDSETKRQTAINTLKDFFLRFSPEKSKAILWECVTIMASDSFAKQPESKRYELLTFYVYLLELLEAAHEIQAKKKM